MMSRPLVCLDSGVRRNDEVQGQADPSAFRHAQFVTGDFTDRPAVSRQIGRSRDVMSRNSLNLRTIASLVAALMVGLAGAAEADCFKTEPIPGRSRRDAAGDRARAGVGGS